MKTKSITTNKHRYVATVEFYVYAENDQAVKNKLNALVDKQRAKHDNNYSILSVVQQDFGEIGNRPVFNR